MMESTKDKEIIVQPNYRKTKNSLTGQQSIVYLILVFCQIDRLIIAGITMLRLISLSFFVSSLAFASEDLHSIGVGYSYSDIRNDDSEVTSELNDLITSHYSLSYQYKVSDYFSIGLGYLKGDSSDADGLLDIFTNSKIDYSAVLFSLAINYPVSKRNYLYLKTSLLEFDYDIIDDSKIVYTESGRDFSFSFGWGYEFDNGIGIKAGYEKLHLGEHLDVGGFNTTIKYRF